MCYERSELCWCEQASAVYGCLYGEECLKCGMQQKFLLLHFSWILLYLVAGVVCVFVCLLAQIKMLTTFEEEVIQVFFYLFSFLNFVIGWREVFPF